MAIPVPPVQASEPNQTLYIRNLNERASLSDLTSALQTVFSHFGPIIDIVAKGSVNRKGQAFIVFDKLEDATEAKEMLDGFSVFERPMMVQFARTPSDRTVEKGGAGKLEAWKRTRGVEKERKQAQAAALASQNNAKRPLSSTIDPTSAAGRAANKSARTAGRPTATGAAVAAGAAAIVPDEYLPPNKVLFLQNIAEEYDKDMLTQLFAKFSGFKEVRMVPSRKGIAFVEYVDEESGIRAKNEMANQPLGAEGKRLKVTYQRQ